MTDLVFYTNPMSRGRIARWMLEEVGAPYETRYIQYGDEMQGTTYRAINPLGKVPALAHKGRVVTECAAICAYLADAFPEAGLAPPPDQRAAYYRWLFFAAGPVEAATSNKASGFEPPADKRAMMGYGDFDTMMAGLNHAVSTGPFVCGDTFSAADVYLGSQVGWGLQFGTLPGSPALEAYRDRVYGREAYTRATAQDDAAMADHGPTQP
ncbi:MAG: glutathione S-transferase family protein [Pseudomonadota bacterium]